MVTLSRGLLYLQQGHTVNGETYLVGTLWSDSRHDVDLQVVRTLDFRVEGELLQVWPVQTLFDQRSSPLAQDGVRGRWHGPAAGQERSAEAVGGEDGWAPSLQVSVGEGWRECSGGRSEGKSEERRWTVFSLHRCVCGKHQRRSRTLNRVSRRRTNIARSRCFPRKVLGQHWQRHSRLVAMPPSIARRTGNWKWKSTTHKPYGPKMCWTCTPG